MMFDINEFVDELHKKFEQKYDPTWIMPSEITTCLRKSFYIRKKGKNVIGESAVYGIAIHNTVQDVAKKFNCEIEKEVNGKIDGIEIKGRADLVCSDSVIEIKTTTIHDQRHYFQLAIYAKLLNLNKAYMLYIDRDTANITFFQIDISFVLPFAIERVRAFTNALVNNKLPSKEYSSLCKYCIYKTYCDNDTL